MNVTTMNTANAKPADVKPCSMKCPCGGCQDRNAECHSNCKPYLEWAAMKRQERIHTNRERANLDAMWDYNGRRKR